MEKRYLGVIMILIASILWGTTGVAATFAPQVGSLAIGAAAMGIGGMLQALIAIRPIYRHRVIIYRQWHWVVLGALAITVYPLAFYSSMSWAGVTVGTVVSIGFAPVFSAVIEWLMDGSKITVRWMMGAVAGLIGIILLYRIDSRSQFSDIDFSAVAMILGVTLGLLAGFTYAFYSWAARHLMQNHVPGKAVMGVIFGLGGLFLMPILFMTGKPFLNSWNNMEVGLYMSLVPMFMGYLCFGYGLAHVRSSMAIMITLMEPVMAAIFAAVILGETVSGQGWIGIGLVFSCLIFVTFPIKVFRTGKKTV